ncbi:MAG TPA: hypothetical protein VE619_02555 [Nitrososphaeraceae archaeon]|nr:hypothetical protein [Nitrososphaeraceae archaeon]
MARRTNKLIAERSTAIEGPPSSSNTNDNLLSSSLERKITLAIEGFATFSSCLYCLVRHTVAF